MKNLLKIFSGDKGKGADHAFDFLKEVYKGEHTKEATLRWAKTSGLVTVILGGAYAYLNYKENKDAKKGQN